MQKKKPGTVRIIGGEWRGRRLPVPDIAGLRPSGDRARETLFNWLQPHLVRADCIDLFAGTGVLGLEAVSRGAASAVLVEKSPAATAAIRSSLAKLGDQRVSLIQGDALTWLQGRPRHSADLVLVDPPFALGLAQKSLEALQQTDIVRPGGLVYLESARSEAAPQAGPNWQVVREQLMGEVRMQLFRKAPLEP